MDKVISFGATDTGKRIYKDIRDEMDVIACVDEDSGKWGTSVYGISVKKPQEIVAMQFDYIYIGVLTYYKQVLALLKKLGGGFRQKK